MTDNEIIKALECCWRNANYAHCTSDCPLYEYCESDEEDEMNICGLALDLINRQKAETERLKKAFSIKFDDLATEYDSKMKSEAIKEFAERLKKQFLSQVCCDRIQFIQAEYELDNLVRGMTD